MAAPILRRIFMNLNREKKEEKVTMIRNILKEESCWVHEDVIFKDFYFDVVQQGEANFEISPSDIFTLLMEQCHHERILPDYRFTVDAFGSPFKMVFEYGLDGCLFSILCANTFHYDFCFLKYLDSAFDSMVDISLSILSLFAKEGSERKHTHEYMMECVDKAVSIATEAFDKIKKMEETHE